MTLQVKRITAVTPDPQKISGVTFMLTFNQASMNLDQILGIEKVGNDFQVMYIHDSANEGQEFVGGLIFLDENVNITLAGDVTSLGKRYIGKFDLAGTPKHVIIQI